MSPTRESLDIAIVGGGIGGACLAAALVRAIPSASITIYESAHAFGEVGAGIALGPNAHHALELMSPDLKQAFDKVATHNLGTGKQDVFLDFRIGQHPDLKAMTLEDEQIIATLKSEGGQTSTQRSQLLEEFVKLLPEGIAHFGKRLSQLEQLDNDAGIRLTFLDGTQATHGCVIGCDGIKSASRKYILGADAPGPETSFSKRGCFRGLVPMEDAIAAIGRERAMSCNNYLGSGGHFIHMPVAGGKLVTASAFRQMETWDHDDWTVPVTKEEMMKGFEGWCPTVRGLLPLVQNTSVWGMFDTLEHPLPTYAKGSFCVMGDAAHASTPYQGAGGSMAIEDAYVLSNLLRKAVTDAEKQNLATTALVANAFTAYDAVRRERTQQLVATSREAGMLWAYQLEEFGSDITKIKANIKNRMKWIWDEDLPAELVAAEQLMDAALEKPRKLT